MHLGSLESTQEARVALGYRLEQLLRFFRALRPNFPSASITRCTHAEHEPILNYTVYFKSCYQYFPQALTPAPTLILKILVLLIYTTDCLFRIANSNLAIVTKFTTVKTSLIINVTPDFNPSIKHKLQGFYCQFLHEVFFVRIVSVFSTFRGLQKAFSFSFKCSL